MARAVIFALAVSGCQGDLSPQTYSVGPVGKSRLPVVATLVDIQPVSIQTSVSGAGVPLGALGGGLAGAAAFGGTRVGAGGVVAGIIIGAAVGAAIESSANRRPAFVYTVNMNGNLLVTVLQIELIASKPGDSVLLSYGPPMHVNSQIAN